MMVWVLSLECLRPADGHGGGGWVQDVVAPSTKGHGVVKPHFLKICFKKSKSCLLVP